MRTALLAALIAVAGCGGTAYEAGQRDIFDPGRIDQIKKGASTKDNILVLFGQPEGKEFAANGDEVWTYGYVLKQLNPNPFGRATLHVSNLSVTFDDRGIVKAYKTDTDKL